ncbi:MAG TPA: alpha/beta hydrolase [Burkholderiaceae bacterium]|nr:alpha/beta hydrolase [Burkholderiaceae bacterium]
MSPYLHHTSVHTGKLQQTACAPTVVFVPGWRNSGPGHWQSLWQARLPNALRVEQDDWLTPTRRAWVDRLADTIAVQARPVILVAHSLGCITVAHLPLAASARVKASLLVAPADPERRGQLADFAPVPHQPLPYRSIVVASDNDPFCPVRLATAYSRAWGSDLVKLVGAGHINVESGHGDWPLGWGLLQALQEESTERQPCEPLYASVE